MKRFKFLFFFICMIGLVSCKDKDTDSNVNTTDDERMQNSINLAEQMAAGDFSEVTDQLKDELITDTLNETSLKNTWDVLTMSLGSFDKIEEELCETTIDGELTSDKVILRFEAGGISLIFTYNKALEIENIGTNLYTFE